ncbi:hypothetical protein EK21DRAFT_59821 [Setomelanomma holmii]|uniref:Rhodopsin domain-containing protein n=1 Tax=Setomelanomma holmii TaxID=210430 RepID=A0A9P4HEL2_9PLEO|nr:hypothetical protein EK21DRAFT_59821 [Setomelanomma holmii]
MPPPPTPEQIAFNNSSQILAITGTCLAIASLVVLFRCYVRLHMLKVFGIDDWMMLLALIFCAATFACFKIRVDDGLGHHMMVLFILYPSKFVNLTKVQYVQAITMMVGISTVKVSIALTLLRLGAQQRYKWILRSAILFLITMTIACAATLVFQCLPIKAAWDVSIRPPPFGTGTAKCYSTETFRNLGLMNSSFNIATDVLFAALPIPLIWGLQLNWRTKISLIAILSLGWFACAAAVIKAVKQWNVLNELDWTVDDSFNVWNFIEFTVGIVAASLPTLKPLFKGLLESARTFTAGTRASGYKTQRSKSSLGYTRTNDPWSKDITMESFSNSSPTSSKGPYHVKISTQPTGILDLESRNSDEGAHPLQPRHALGPTGIVRTREISVV